jgi:hypothetical protein
LAAIGNDWTTAARVLPKVLAAAGKSWVARTTRDNLALLRDARRRDGQELPRLEGIIRHLEARAAELG